MGCTERGVGAAHSVPSPLTEQMPSQEQLRAQAVMGVDSATWRGSARRGGMAAAMTPLQLGPANIGNVSLRKATLLC